MDKNTNFKEAMAFLEKKVKIYDNFFYKGINSDFEIPDIILKDPNSSVRKSKTQDIHGNIYDLLLNNLPSWREYPRRNKSIIMTDSLDIAKSFANKDKGIYKKTFQVFPKYNSKIVVAPESDIWFSFMNGLGMLGLKGEKAKLQNFNRYLVEILKSNLVDEDIWTYESILSSLRALFKTAPYSINQLCFESKILFGKLKEFNKTPEEIFDNLLSPNLNGFEIKKFNKSYELDNSNVELWTNAKYLLVNIEKVDEILSELNF